MEKAPNSKAPICNVFNHFNLGIRVPKACPQSYILVNDEKTRDQPQNLQLSNKVDQGSKDNLPNCQKGVLMVDQVSMVKSSTQTMAGKDQIKDLGNGKGQVEGLEDLKDFLSTSANCINPISIEKSLFLNHMRSEGQGAMIIDNPNSIKHVDQPIYSSKVVCKGDHIMNDNKQLHNDKNQPLPYEDFL